MIGHEPTEVHVERPDAYEHQDVHTGAVTRFLIGLFVSLGLVIVVVWGIYELFAAMGKGTVVYPSARHMPLPPEPRIQAAPLVDQYNFRKHEEEVLESYGWINRQAGIAHIPIGRAMDLLVQRGLPVRTGAGTEPTVPETGPDSGGPQTGSPMPRFNRPPGLESSESRQASPANERETQVLERAR